MAHSRSRSGWSKSRRRLREAGLLAEVYSPYFRCSPGPGLPAAHPRRIPAPSCPKGHAPLSSVLSETRKCQGCAHRSGRFLDAGSGISEGIHSPRAHVVRFDLSSARSVLSRRFGSARTRSPWCSSALVAPFLPPNNLGECGSGRLSIREIRPSMQSRSFRSLGVFITIEKSKSGRHVEGVLF